MLRMRNPETILWLERAGLSRLLCQTLIMQRAMEQEFGCQQENTSFSFWYGVNESVVGLWNCHVWYAGFLTVNACPCCLLFERDLARFFLDCLYPHSEPHCSRAGGLLCPQVLIAEEMAP